MALSKVLSFIHYHIGVTKKELNGLVQNLFTPKFFTYVSDGNNFIRILSDIRNAVEESHCGSDLEKIKQALSLIQQIRFERPGKKPRYFAEYAEKRGYTLLVPFDESQYFDPLKYNHKHYEDVFGSIYQTLIEYLLEAQKFQHKCKWQITLPEDNNLEIMNEQVKEWQEKQTELYSDNNAYKDYRRGTIFGIQFPTLSEKNLQTFNEEELTTALIEFIKGAKAYPSEDEQQLILQWLQNNGGQYNSRFIDMMLMNQCITDSSIAPAASQPNAQHWYISRNGKICLNLDISYYSLLLNSEGGLFVHIAKAKKSWLRNSDQGALNDDPAIAAGTPKSRSPVLRVNAIVELSIEPSPQQTNVVVPHVTFMQVLSFTSLLKKKEQPVVDPQPVLRV